ncbi:MAG: zinc-ribbon domain-containing protein [Pseudomonadota bacterium]
MKIACEACGAKYTIADDKVRGRRVKIRCKGCGTPIVVDGQNGGGPNISDVETDAALEAEAPVTWSVNLSDTDSRTMSTEEIVAAYASGVVTADAFVWKDGMADWVPLLDSELAPLLPSAPTGARPDMPLFTAPNQASQASRPAATTHAAQPNLQDLFGSLDTAGSEEDVGFNAPNVPQAGSGAYDDGKLTGARNENSVLFSLDALKAGFSPSAPSAAKPQAKVPTKGAPGAARPQQPSNPDDPFGMSAAAGLGGGGVLFGADNQALMTAPAPPPPPVAPVPSPFVSGAMPAPYAPKSNNMLVYIVGGVGGVVIIGLLLALLLGKKGDSSATADNADNSAVPSASAAPLSVSEKPAEEAKKEEPAKPAEAPSATASASAAPSAKPAPVAPIGVAAVKKPKEEAPPPADAQPFSKASAISALTAAASSAGSCKKPGGPTGPGKATVTFAPSGRVTTATVAGGSYAGTGVGGCVASVFRRAHVPPFSGSSVTVSKSFQIN